jgi:hypothetical protein
MSRRDTWLVAASVAWLLLCVRWFDVAAPWRPSVFQVVPPWLLAAALVGALAAWALGREPAKDAPLRDTAGLLLVVGLALLFRLPLVVQGAAGAVTPDGALSGIVALHARDGVEHLVFVPNVPYSGSLKSHLTAPIAAVLDPARSFALVSVSFYGAFVAGVFVLGLRVEGGAVRVARAAGLFAAFAPAFVTRYSVSNDGNYVEVLALGAWALVLAIDGMARPFRTIATPLAIGVLLGLAFWCHILALVPIAAVGLGLLMADARRAVRASVPIALGLALGYAPGLLWNAANEWESFGYLVPGGTGVGDIAKGPGLGGRIAGMVTGQWPVLMGYDPGHPPALDLALLVGAWLAVALALAAIVQAARAALASGTPVLRTLLAWVAVNVAMAAVALPLVAGNPRYLLFVMVPLPVLLARAFSEGRPRYALAGIVALGAVGSLAQLPGTARADRQWREFVAALQSEGVRHCYTDFFLATKVNFLSGESVVCSAKLGPTTTEYFFDYRRQVDAAPSAALVAVNAANAEKLERRLERLGVTCERRELMKPVLLRLSRKVDPQELFPDRSFPMR